MILASIPSPDQGVWHLGPLPIRAYALCIILGVVVAVWLGEKRWVARGGRPGQVSDIAVWAVPFGLVGGRLYHVITDYKLYFGEGRDPIRALYVWQGGLGIWGAVALGAVGAYIGCRQQKVRFLTFGDAIAPGIIIAQAIGRWGNWFNQELYGRPTTLPWGLEIDPEHRVAGYEQYTTFHPTYLYECVWNLGVAGLLLWADRRFRLGYGRVFALYIMGYTAGRGWIEYLRIDTVQENDVFGLRLNVWTSIVVFLFGLGLFLWSARVHPGREETVFTGPQPDEPSAQKSGDSEAG
ncbi:prolipoprotein diacylglyceryl transferase [Nocardioides mesophilus]|uniref:Phosphatidylglycerol--prolipoprotein diacylglyceryl transferase n=1 Tax=Nocardioides mesophilus TaxID=433659 RepID=A0A7G9RBS9_9ACTN|nr:prolipoprotein diacylglyceryl transferase [Nocardioides mesophilus]QNN53054.1 prolipoprotein diacylglyceryl transferase [Nocardioides mesophilus]